MVVLVKSSVSFVKSRCNCDFVTRPVLPPQLALTRITLCSTTLVGVYRNRMAPLAEDSDI